MADDRITRQVVEYFTDLKYEDLPEDVVHTAKRIFMDIVGCGLGSHPLDKGATAVKLVKAKGGAPEATILGTGEKLPMDEVAFANGELMHSMDFNAISPPLYVAPMVCPATLAVAENQGRSGKDFLTAMVAGFEIAMRIGQSLGNFRSREIKTRASGTTWDTMGVAIAAGKLMGFNKEQMTNAFGLSGYFAPIPCLMKYMHTANNGMHAVKKL